MKRKIEEKRMEYQAKIIDLIRKGFDYNQIALEIERSEGSNFSRGILITAFNEIREGNVQKPQENVVGKDKCPKCRNVISILVNKCPFCNAVTRCPKCDQKVHIGQSICSRCLSKL